MDLKNEVLASGKQADKGLTVEEVAHELALRIEGDTRSIRSALNALSKAKQIDCDRGAGGYPSRYFKVPLERRI